MSSALKNAPADIVRQLMLDKAVAPNVFAGVVPALPDDLVTVFNTTDVIDARSMRATLMQHYGIQLRIRSDVFDTGNALAAELQRWMAEDVLNEIVTGGVRLQANQYKLYNFAKIGPVLRLGMDVSNDKRFNFTVNALVVIKGLN